MPRKSWVDVPDLGRKLDLLVDRQVFRTMTELARALGISRPTLYRWLRDSVGGRQDAVPVETFQLLAGRFAPLLAHLSATEQRAVLTGPVAALVDEIDRPTVIDRSLIAFLDGARTGEGRVIRRADDLSLVTVASSSAPAPETPTIAIGEPFRIEFLARHRCRHALLIQNAGRRWGSVPIEFAAGGATVLSPGSSAGGDQEYLVESEQEGLHRFFCIQSTATPPLELRARLAEPFEIDRRTMSDIVRFHEGLARPDRALQRLDVIVERG